MEWSTNQVSGLASGFDWGTMVDQLHGVEHRRVDLVEDSKTNYESELAAWQSFNSNLLELKTAAEALTSPEDFSLFTSAISTDSTSVEGQDLFTATTDTEASPGSYAVKVKNLARSQKLSSNPFTSLTAELGSAYAGDMILNGRVVTVQTTDTLSDVASRINQCNTGADPSGVSAGIVHYGACDYRLVLTSDETGEEGISLLNGSSLDLVQKFGWKDGQAAQLKNGITSGVQSDLFASHNQAIQSLLGLSTGEASTGTLTIGGTAVTINLATMSLTDIKAAVNGAGISGVSASVVSHIEDGATSYRLQIDGTQAFTDEKNILSTLGILDHTSADVTGKVSETAMTSEGGLITPDTLLVDIDGFQAFTSGDYLALSGSDTEGNSIGTVSVDITPLTTLQDLMDDMETQYGDVIAYVTPEGNLRVDDLTANGHLDVKVTDVIQDGNSSLEFVTGDGFFGAAAARKREIVAGEDALVEIDGVDVTQASNLIEDVIPGVTLNLVGEDTAATATLNINRDIEGIKAALQTFMDKYNSVMTYINAQFAFDEESGETGGVLFGDSTLRSVKADLTSLLTQSIWGLDGDFSYPGLIGINMGNDLTLSMDEAELTGYLQTNFNDVMSLFAAQGSASSSALGYVNHSGETQAGEYDVHVRRAATRGLETGTVDLSAGGADETLTITQGNAAARITLTQDMAIEDVVHEINAELDAERNQTLVGNEPLFSDAGQLHAMSAQTTWDAVYDDLGGALNFQDDDILSFSGTARDGIQITGTYQIEDASSDTVQGLLSAIEDAFSSEVTAAIDASGRLVIGDKYQGVSQLSLSSVTHPSEGAFFGSIGITDGAGDGSQRGRYAMGITAMDDGSGHLSLRSDSYGSSGFTLAQDTTDQNYDRVVFTETRQTTGQSSGTVPVTGAATWSQVYGAGVSNNDTITISGTKRDGSDFGSDHTYTIHDTGADTLSDLLGAIESAFASEGISVNAYLREGRLFVEDTTAGASSISLGLTCNNEGAGSLDLGVFDQNTERDLDLGLINGAVTGRDIAGTIGGEGATGTGQILKGNTGNANTDGLSVMYTGTSDQTNAGTLTMTIGLAELFDRVLFNITDTYDGYVSFKQDSLQDRIQDLGEQIENMEARLDKKMENMINRFVAMELALSEMQNQSSWLTGQLNAASGGWV